MPDFSPAALRKAAKDALDADPRAMSYDDVSAGDPAAAAAVADRPSHAGMHAALAAMGIGQGLDAASTIQALRAGSGSEANPVYGSDPSAARVLATKVAPMALLGYLLDQKLHDAHPLVAKITALALGGAGAAAAAHNYGVMRDAKR